MHASQLTGEQLSLSYGKGKLPTAGLMTHKAEGSETLTENAQMELGVDTHTKYPGQISPFPKREAN